MKRRKIICMASFPKRYNGMINRLEELCPQCDVFQLYISDYESIPEKVHEFKNCIPILVQKDTLHDKGKFYGLDKFKDDYVLTVDDDFSYPNNYVEYMCNKLDNHPNSVITLLGVEKDSLQYVFPRDAFYEEKQSILAGTGWAAFIPNNIKFFPQLKDLEDDNFGADAVLAMHCRDNSINIYIVQREKDFVKLTRYVGLNWHNDKFNAHKKYKEYDVNWVHAELAKTSVDR